MAGISSKANQFGNPSNKLKYNGKEEQREEFSDESGLEWLDYGARMYDNQVCRFFQIDPISSNYPAFTTYCYAINNPTRYIDILGLGPGDRVKKAESYAGKPYKQQYEWVSGERTFLRTGESAEALQFLDCSELVCRVLYDDGLTNDIESMATGQLLTFLNNTDVYERSDIPKVGDIFLWRIGDKGHTGIITKIDESYVYTAEAHSTKKGVVKDFRRKITDFTEHAGWKGFYRPKKENQKNQTSNKEKSKNKFLEGMPKFIIDYLNKRLEEELNAGRIMREAQSAIERSKETIRNN